MTAYESSSRSSASCDEILFVIFGAIFSEGQDMDVNVLEQTPHGQITVLALGDHLHMTAVDSTQLLGSQFKGTFIGDLLLTKTPASSVNSVKNKTKNDNQPHHLGLLNLFEGLTICINLCIVLQAFDVCFLKSIRFFYSSDVNAYCFKNINNCKYTQ